MSLGCPRAPKSTGSPRRGHVKGKFFECSKEFDVQGVISVVVTTLSIGKGQMIMFEDSFGAWAAKIMNGRRLGC